MSFETFKHLLPTVLDFSEVLILECDVSIVGIMTVISQRGNPIEFF